MALPSEIDAGSVDRRFDAGFVDTGFVPHAEGLYRRACKRLLDCVLVLLAAPVAVPAILLLAALIRLDGGPAFYTQERIGRHGRRFRIWKLRSMRVGADALLAAHLAADPAARAEWESTQKLKDDPRVTAVGRPIRKSSLDELPQLWNVLRGDMSLVGPRPMLPDQVPLYPYPERERAYYSLRPGLTGFWQVRNRNRATFASRAGYDSFYAERVSFATDLRLLLATVQVVLRGTGH
jgi:lipopolysaccharide/colanic/teichoic acid biosynthesis glycosyltransferase